MYKQRGFVLPFTLLICAIMLLISVGISTVLMKQIYFSNLGRESQSAYYAADNALACTIAIEDTYTSPSGDGMFPSDPLKLITTENINDMSVKLDSINALRAANEPPLMPLAATLTDIKCAQSSVFDTDTDVSDFTVLPTPFHREIPAHDSVPATTEDGVTTTFKMKMRIDGDIYRCAKVTVNKTVTYKQIIAQGYSRCDKPSGSIERAVVYSTVQ